LRVEDIKELVMIVLSLVDGRHEYSKIFAYFLRCLFDKYPDKLSMLKSFVESKILHDLSAGGLFAYARDVLI
jgi:hypothetical protein